MTRCCWKFSNDFVTITWRSTQQSVCEVEEVEYLGYTISPKGIEMSKDKVTCVLSWETPTCLKAVQSFLGFANFYRRFIKHFSIIAKPLTDSTKLDKKSWKWTKHIQSAFDTLKLAFTKAPAIAYFDSGQGIHIDTDARDFGLRSVMSQKGGDGRFHPVAFHSRKLIPTEINFDIHDKELLAIVDSMTRWRHYLEGAKHWIQVFSDHHNLAYFQTAKVLNRRQARWAQLLAGFDFVINFKPGSQNQKADILSRREEYHPEGGDENQPVNSVLQERHFAVAPFSNSIDTVHRRRKEIEGPSFLLSKARLCSIPAPKWNDDFLSRVMDVVLADEEY